jgi:LPXTG-motif cell wall-anchored protein
MKRNYLSRFSALFAAILIALTSITPAFAASNDTIDASKVGSLTVYKYDVSAAEEGGVDISQFTATGEKDSAAETVLNPYALPGVEFSYTKIGNITTYSKSGNIEVVYNIPSTLCSILKLGSAEAELTEGDTYYYTSDTLNTALAEVLTNNTEGKDKLEAWAAANKLTAMEETDSTGKTSVKNLELGLYMVIETKVPQNVYSTTNPFFVSIPMTNSTGDCWFYDVSVYPKNQTNDPTLDKLVSENGTYADTATVSQGDVLDYRLVSQLPAITSTATYLSQYTYVDQLSKGLTYNKDVTIFFYDKEEDAKNGTGSPIATWTAKSNPVLFNTAYENTNDGTRLTIVPTKDGLKEMNTKYSEKYMVVAYTTTVTSTADMVLGDSGNTNDVKLTYSRTNSTYTNTIEDKAIVYIYGIDLTKTFSDNEGDATQVRFVLKNKTDDYYVTAVGADGVYYVTGQAETEDAATVFSPNKSGKLKINGLEADQYILTEIGTDSGYSLLKNDIIIEFTPTDATILASEAAVTGIGSEQENCEVILNTSASVKVDNNDTAMSPDMEDTNSANALVQISVLNSRTFVLPQTGGAGTWAVTILGVLGVAGGAFILRKGKKSAKMSQTA